MLKQSELKQHIKNIDQIAAILGEYGSIHNMLLQNNDNLLLVAVEIWKHLYPFASQDNENPF